MARRYSSRLESVGTPLDGISCDVVDDLGTPVADGVEGELVIRSPFAVAGYYDNASATAEAFRDGGYFSGDLGRRDADGQHVLARSLVMATGARWREMHAEGMDRFRGAGVYHAAMSTDAERARDKDVIVIGGGNSAGQAAAALAQHARSVRVVVRGSALKSTLFEVPLPTR